jgi:hypothetical protein
LVSRELWIGNKQVRGGKRDVPVQRKSVALESTDEHRADCDSVYSGPDSWTSRDEPDPEIANAV